MTISMQLRYTRVGFPYLVSRLCLEMPTGGFVSYVQQEAEPPVIIPGWKIGMSDETHGLFIAL